MTIGQQHTMIQVFADLPSDALKQPSAPQTLQILYLEDDRCDRELAVRALAKAGLECQFRFVETQAEFEGAVQAGTCQLILADFNLPSYDGLSALAFARDQLPQIPFLFVSGTIGEQQAVATLKSGAADYVSKANLDQLAPAVRRALREAGLQQARQLAEENLQQSEARYRKLVEMCPDAIYVEYQGNFIFANPAGLRLLGASREEQLLGTAVLERFHPEAKDAVTRLLATVRNEARSVNTTEYKCLRLDASVVEAEVIAAPFQFGDKHATQMLVRDISERKRTEQEKRLLADRLSLATRAASIGVWDADLMGDKVVWDAAMYRLYGISPYQAVDSYKDWLGLLHPADRPRIENEVQMALRGDKPFATDFRVIWRDGSVHHLKASGFVQRDSSGRPLRILGTNWDITKRKEAEAELRWKTAFLEAQVNSSLDGILVVNHEGKTILQNQRLIELWNIPADLVKESEDPRRLEFVIQRTTRPEQFLAKVKHLYAHPKEISRDEIELTDGKILERFSSPVLGKDGTNFGRIWTFRDVTERKLLESELRQAQKMEAIGQLAGGVAHDFNNMLAAILLNVQILLMDSTKLGPEAKDGLMQIAAATERAAGLTRQLLAFSRKQVMQTQPVRLNEIIANLTKMLRRIIGEDIELQCEFEAELPPVEADTGMMEQILLNLVINSRDAMPQGGKLRLRTETVVLDEASAARNPDARAGRFACMAVSDDGTGIAPEHLPRIFEPFFTTKDPGKGTGLGLATVYGIVKQHRGWVEVASRVGEGTTFRVFLPQTVTDASSGTAPAEEPQLQGGSETILLVEDDVPVRVITRRVLERWGYKVLEATCAREASEVWTQHRQQIALVLTDIVMPEGITGRDLAEQLRTQQPGLKVIFMSGYSGEALGKDTEFFRRTRSHFLQKPCPPGKLLRTLRQCLEEP